MEVEIRPEPSDEEREVIEAALARLPAERGGSYSAAWRRAGLDELDEAAEGT